MTEDAWRLRIRDITDDGRPGPVLGAGFVVAEGTGLTCAHVVGGLDECWVDVPATGESLRCQVRFAKPDWKPSDPNSTDVALITLPRQLRPAPLGPLEPPRVSTVLDALGYPERYAKTGDRGQRTQVRVVGEDIGAGVIQVDGLVNAEGQIQPGYSGGAMVDLASGRVVGMVVSSDKWRELPVPPPPMPDGGPPSPPWSPQRSQAREQYNEMLRRHLDSVKHKPAELKIAWFIPLRTLAAAWPPLTSLLPRRITVDPEFLQAVTEIHLGAYVHALTRLNGLLTIYPDEPDMYFYRAIAGLAGVRPGSYALPMIQAVEQLLKLGAQKSTTGSTAHFRVLLALVKEDYYIPRGIDDPDEDPLRNSEFRLAHLRDAVDRIDDHYSNLILGHVPARECPTWRALYTKRGNS